MTSSNLSVQKSNPLLQDNLERLGAREIGIWKEMILQDKVLFKDVYNLIYSDNSRIAWHASWVIDHVSEAEPGLLEVFIPELIDHLPYLKSSSLKRHVTRMLISQKIPENKMGQLIDILYKLLSPAEAIAVRANSLQILLNIALIEPDLQSELIIVTESILEEELTSGMKSKARRVLKRLSLQ